MNCSQERSIALMEYAEGNLPPVEAGDLERHLTSCDSCRAELDGWRRLEGQLRAFPLVAEPVSFKASVMSQVVASRPAPMPVAYRPVDPTVAAALGFILLGLGLALSGAGNWELRFDTAYWLDLSRQLADTGLNLGLAAAGRLLAGLLEAASSGIMDSAPILTAALLLALFALGPSEIVNALRLERAARE